MIQSMINKVLKRKVIKSISVLGMGLKELVFDIELSEITINSIEYNNELNLLILHVFNDSLDMVYDFDELSENDKLTIIKVLDSI
jgi:hypothetical protein